MKEPATSRRLLDSRSIDRSERTGGAERNQRNVDDVITEAPAVRPAAWNKSSIFERILSRALQDVASEDAEAIETLGAREPRRRGGEIDLDQVGDEYGVEQPWNDRRRSQRMRQSWVIGIFCVERRVHLWRDLVVPIFNHLQAVEGLCRVSHGDLRRSG
jgi:hypothetical protein